MDRNRESRPSSGEPRAEDVITDLPRSETFRDGELKTLPRFVDCFSASAALPDGFLFFLESSMFEFDGTTFNSIVLALQRRRCQIDQFGRASTFNILRYFRPLMSLRRTELQEQCSANLKCSHGLLKFQRHAELQALDT